MTLDVIYAGYTIMNTVNLELGKKLYFPNLFLKKIGKILIVHKYIENLKLRNT